MFMYIMIISYIPPLLLKSLHKYSLKICDIFLDVKTENGIFGKNKQTERQNRHAFYTTTVNFKRKLAQ